MIGNFVPRGEDKILTKDGLIREKLTQASYDVIDLIGEKSELVSLISFNRLLSNMIFSSKEVSGDDLERVKQKFLSSLDEELSQKSKEYIDELYLSALYGSNTHQTENQRKSLEIGKVVYGISVRIGECIDLYNE